LNQVHFVVLLVPRIWVADQSRNSAQKIKKTENKLWQVSEKAAVGWWNIQKERKGRARGLSILY